jgi:hypothetical protein
MTYAGAALRWAFQANGGEGFGDARRGTIAGTGDKSAKTHTDDRTRPQAPSARQFVRRLTIIEPSSRSEKYVMRAR